MFTPCKHDISWVLLKTLEELNYFQEDYKFTIIFQYLQRVNIGKSVICRFIEIEMREKDFNSKIYTFIYNK